MPLCPKCGEWIGALNSFEKVWQMYLVKIVKGEAEYKAEYESNELEGCDDDPEIECPVCNEVLFCNIDDGVKFLKSCRKKRLKKKCDKCEQRFKCWTARKEGLDSSHGL